MRTALRRLCDAVLISMVLPSTGLAQDDRWISAEDARQHIGETVTVCDSVTGARFVPTSPGQPTYLNFGPPSPNQTLTVVVWGVQRARFETPPERLYRNRRVCVTGTVDSYRSRPQIVVENPTAIRVVAPAEPPRPIRMTTRGSVRAMPAFDPGSE